MDTIDAIVNTLNEAAKCLGTAEEGRIKKEYRDILTYLQARYPTVGIINTGNGPALDTHVNVALALRRVNAQQDPTLLQHAEVLRRRMDAAPQDLLAQVGVDLDNVHANSIVIKDIYVNRATEPEPVQQLTIVEYLKALVREEKNEEAGETPNSASAMRARLDRLPFYVRHFDEADDSRFDIVEAVETSFREDAEIGRIERVVILSDSGVGNTPALHYIRLRIVQATLDALPKDPAHDLDYATFADRITLPIYINLAELQPGLTLQRIVCDQFNRHLGGSEMRLEAEQVPDVLKRHVCFFLLDSLDSLSSNPAGLQQVRQFIDENPDEKYVIACRTVSYRTQLGSIDTLGLDDLSRQEAISVLGQQRYMGLYASLGTLTYNRLMLYMIIDLYEMNGWPELLVNKGQIIRAYAVDHIQRNLERFGEGADEIDLVEAALEHLAYSMQCDHVLCYTDHEIMRTIMGFLDEWSERRTWRDVFRILRKIEMVERDERRKWRLTDRTVAAYFAAAAIANDPAKLERALDQVSDLWWRDVFEILAGLIPEPTNFFFDLMDRDVLVAANCAQYRTINAKVANALINALIERMARADVATVERIASRLGESGRPRAAEALLRALYRESTSRGVYAIARAIWTWVRQRSFEALIEAEEQVMQSSIQDWEPFAELLLTYERLMVSTGPRRAHYEEQLLGGLASPDASRLKRGLGAVGLGFSESEEAHDTLLTLLKSRDEDPFVSWCATDALTQSRRPRLEQEAAAIFADRTDLDHPARPRAVYLLGWIARTKKTWALLRNEAIADSNASVRAYAAEAFVRLDLPDSRQAIEQCLDHETDPLVVDKCAKALAIVGTTASLPSLERHLFCERARTRWAVKSAIQELRQRTSSEIEPRIWNGH